MDYRERTKAAYEAEKERLGKGGERDAPRLSHNHWTGQLEFVDESGSQVCHLKRRLVETMGSGEPVRSPIRGSYEKEL